MVFPEVRCHDSCSRARDLLAVADLLAEGQGAPRSLVVDHANPRSGFKRCSAGLSGRIPSGQPQRAVGRSWVIDAPFRFIPACQSLNALPSAPNRAVRKSRMPAQTC
jgi:hypothetical protein